MASKIINISLNENMIQFCAGHILSLKNNGDFSDIAVIMPSKRPALFIKKELSKKINKPFIPPVFFTFDELTGDIAKKYYNLQKISQIDSAYSIFEIVKKHTQSLFDKQASFAEFFQWSSEILAFIEALDIEKIQNDKLLNIQLNADIGYDLPKNINELLKNLSFIRHEFHKYMLSVKKTTRGYSYLLADSKINDYLKEYKSVILFNPYYLNKSETDMFKKIYDENKLDIIIKGSKDNWISIDKIYKDFNETVFKNLNEEKIKNNINFYCAYDGESQACLAKNLLSKIEQNDIKDTVVIVPDNSILPSVMSQIYSIIGDINVAVGYPAKKTTVFSLISAVLQTQKNKKNNKYYIKDIISVLANPLAKNMRFIGNPSVTRIIVHNIMRHFDRFNEEAEFKDYIFINLDDIKNNIKLQNDISRTVTLYWQPVTAKRVKEILDEIFDLFFYKPEKLSNMADTGGYLRHIADNIVEKSLIHTYPFNLGAVNILYDIAGQFEKAVCTNEKFEQHEIFYILEEILLKGNISLIGSPLKGLQILGTMESRGLSFKNVYVLSMSDSFMPSIKEASPLIPKDIMNSLGIGYISRETDIQKYNFMSLIASAENVTLIYPDDEKNGRSRFIEELVWKEQSEKKSLKVANVTKAVLSNKTLLTNKQEFSKTDRIKDFLKHFSYSPTSIDTYLRCKLQFYFKYILQLSEQTDFEQNYERLDIGNFIHEFLEETFHKGLNKDELTANTFSEYQKILDRKLEIFFKQHETGKIFLLKKLIKKRLCDFYENETKRDFKEIIEAESKFISKIEINGIIYNLKLKIDRIDRNSDGSIYIIDYKTGSVEKPLKSKLSGEINGDRREFIQKNIKSFQLPVYKFVYEEKNPGKTIDNCILYSLRDCNKIYLFDTGMTHEDRQFIYDICIENLKYIISEINSEIPFKSESYDKVRCETCPYFYLCR